ncbi:DNA mismatch repair endonuclease MutL [Halobaculum sp. D14]|uniref:DNA mismatch repair endonuclease MutL n=1 Tax=Halobaculum sp. D14 TaxID=3421642 RepID=UPI003EB849B7
MADREDAAGDAAADADAAADTDAGPAAANAEVRELPESTVERIAAGEVVTRPSRVVAELVENSLDAGATRVDVAVDGDGTDRIRVADDGRGMSRADAALAVEPHTTSKLRDAADLESVGTLGFRGEALASVADAADLTVTTNDGGDVGTEVTVADGEVSVSDAGRARGTTVTVTDLFADRPARRESLASPAREFARISSLVAEYAVLRPGVAFSLTHDGTETVSTPGTGVTDALLAVYDRETASQSTAFEHRADVDFAGRTGALRVDGALAYPSTTRSTREHVHVAVNGRPVRNEALRAAVAQGYGSLLPSGREPVAALRLDVPAWAVDPNVHPAKTRVALRAADAVADAVESGVRDALTTADLRRSGEVAMDLDSSLAPVDGVDSDFADAAVIGQFRDLYLLCEADGDLLVVDQHAAHERVNYERLRESLADEAVPSASLDPAETVSLDPGAAAAAEAYRDELGRLGFDVEPFGGTTYRVTAVPAPLGRVADADALRDVLAALRDDAGTVGDDAGGRGGDAGVRDALLADLACHPSLKAGDALDDEAATKLLRRLGECEQPYACPHGRPTVLSVDEATLAAGFERDSARR